MNKLENLPDCMMPDGAEPCKAYGEAYEEVKRLQATIHYLDSKIKSAMNCHPKVVQALLKEAKERTHLNT